MKYEEVHCPYKSKAMVTIPAFTSDKADIFLSSSLTLVAVSVACEHAWGIRVSSEAPKTTTLGTQQTMAVE